MKVTVQCKEEGRRETGEGGKEGERERKQEREREGGRWPFRGSLAFPVQIKSSAEKLDLKKKDFHFIPSYSI